MFTRASTRLSSASQVVALSTRGKANGVKIENASADFLPYKGIPAAYKPVKVQLEAGKTYAWCSCGLSVKQPFCDGSHKPTGMTNARPVRFQVEKSGDYYLCACKQTEHRPLCDSQHKNVSNVPVDRDASRMVAFNNSPAHDYGSVAYKLGYKPKNGGFQ